VGVNSVNSLLPMCQQCFCLQPLKTIITSSSRRSHYTLHSFIRPSISHGLVSKGSNMDFKVKKSWDVAET